MACDVSPVAIRASEMHVYIFIHFHQLSPTFILFACLCTWLYIGLAWLVSDHHRVILNLHLDGWDGYL